MQEMENLLLRLITAHVTLVTLTSNDIFQLQTVESYFAINATPVELFGKGVCKTMLHNSILATRYS